MITLLLIIFIVLTIICFCITDKHFKKRKKNHDDELITSGILFWLFCIISIVLFLWVLTLCYKVGTGYTVDQRIEMYQTENMKIESSIDLLVTNYMNYESDTYKDLKDEDGISLVSLFPDLKSDELVSKQIKLYSANNKKIKQLKEEKIELSKAKWKLYFGR